MTAYISEKVRKQVAERANYRCEYCLMPERFLATFFHVDHIRSVKHGGHADQTNLAYACPHCNQHKGSDIGTFADEENEMIVRFYNPRRDHWTEHFDIVLGEIIPRTAIGRATVAILNVNQPERLLLRRELSFIGQYPG